MKTRTCPVVATLMLLTLLTHNLQFSSVFAQGSLTPPGAPGPTMLTLSQIEPCFGSSVTIFSNKYNMP